MPSSAVMGKFKAGALRSGGAKGPKVTSRKQAIAIAMSERRAEAGNGGKYPERAGKGPRSKKRVGAGIRRAMGA